MGPESAKGLPGQQVVHTRPRPGEGQGRPAERARQEIGHGRRGEGGIFGALRPAAGEALTRPHPSRSAADRVDFPERVEAWVPAEVTRVHAIADNLPGHRAADVLLSARACPRREFAFQPKYAAHLDPIEPWWEARRSLASKGRRFETWEAACRAVEGATARRDKHRRPSVRGRRRRHQPRRRPGIAPVPGVRRLAG